MSNLVEFQPLQVYPMQPQQYPIVAMQPQTIQYAPAPVQPQTIVYDDFRERFFGKVAAFLFGGVCLVGVGYAIAPKPSAPIVAVPTPTPSTPPVMVIESGGKGCQVLCFGQ